MGLRRSGWPWASIGVVALPALFGCAAAETPRQTVYISLDRLLERHPAVVSLSPLPEARVNGFVPEPKPVGSYASLPEPLQSLGPGSGGAPAVEERYDDSSSDRLAVLEASMHARADAAKARDVRLMRSTLAAERAQAMRDVEERIASKQDALSREARPRLRDLDLRILALTAQQGSLAAGPPEDVDRALREAKVARRQMEARLTSEIGVLRNTEYAAVRAQIEQREADIEREVGIADAARRREIDIALRRHREALAMAGRTLPRDASVMPSAGAHTSVRWAIPGRVDDQPSGQATPDTGMAGGAPGVPRSAVRDAALRDLREHVVRLCAQRGWTPTFTPQRGAPDRTRDMARTLREDGWLL